MANDSSVEVKMLKDKISFININEPENESLIKGITIIGPFPTPTV